jgi:hypothetical protein
MSLLEMLGQQLGGDAIGTLSRRLDADERSVGSAVSGALPILMGAMARNTDKPGGAASLLGALDRDHDGSVLDDVVGFLGAASSSDGQGILGHVLGQRQGAVEASLSQSSGLPTAKVGQLLGMLAPLVMGMLGQQKKQHGFDAGGLAALLGGERQKVERGAPEAASLLTGLLDADGDGSVADDVAKLGGSLLGGLFGKK